VAVFAIMWVFSWLGCGHDSLSDDGGTLFNVLVTIKKNRAITGGGTEAMQREAKG